MPLPAETVYFRRECWRFLTTPLAAAMLIFYLVISGILTLTLGGFIDGNSASLEGFFVWQPWLFLFLCSALSMGSWAEEYRTGAAELLLTLPAPPRALVLAKFASQLSLLFVALACTAPFPVTCAILGEPDWGPVATGYLGCLLAGGLFLSLGQWTSVWTNSQFVGFLASFLLGLLGMLAGFRPINLLLVKWGMPAGLLDRLSAWGISGHFEALSSGRLALRDVAFFLAGTLLFLLLTCLALRLRHGPRRRRRLLPALAAALLLLAAAALLQKCPWRLDCTQDRLYTLDPGSLQILDALQTPLEVTLVYSQHHPELSATVRRHAARAQELLREFARRSKGKIALREFSPRSPREQDEAAALGAAPRVGSLGDLWFLGVRVDPRDPAQGQPVTVPWLDPEEPATLEYQLARALAASQRREPRRIGLLSSLTVLETLDQETQKLLPTWWSLRKLLEDFRLVPLDPAKPLPGNLDALLLLHPKDAPESFWDDVLQFHKKGGGILLCLDPLSRVEASQNGRTRLTKASKLPQPLSDLWGVAFQDGRVVADRRLASSMTSTRKGLESFPTLVTLKQENLSQDSPVTQHLFSLTLFCPGEFTATPVPGVRATTLAATTTDAQTLLPYQAKRDGAAILTDFSPDGKSHALALQIQPGEEDDNDGHAAGSAILVGDVDWLHDSLCVNQTTDAAGKELELPLNDNAAFLANAMEFLCDDATLLRLRSRGARRRGFTKLEALARETEQEIQRLEAQAYQDNADLRARGRALLQGHDQDDPATAKALDALEAEDAAQQEALKTRQRAALTVLRHKLDAVQRKVALCNLLLTPAILAAAAIAVALRRRR